MKNQVIAILAEVLRVDGAKITDDLEIGDIPEWTSIAQVELISALEQKLGIEFPIEDLMNLTDVNSIVAEVEKLK